ncbi:MAG: hypothetical protein Q8J78_11740 [Moraxellaceae bacterium]|nr:hypothetical protein [Moraxellaceae bacterium]
MTTHHATRAGRQFFLYAWVAPASAVGLLPGVCALLAGAQAARVDGVLELSGGPLTKGLGFMGIRAITFGHVVLGQSPTLLAALRRHEHTHVRQYERWGLLFFPLYAASSLWQWGCGRDAYRDNCFEREAFGADDSGPSSSAP